MLTTYEDRMIKIYKKINLTEDVENDGKGSAENGINEKSCKTIDKPAVVDTLISLQGGK